MGSENWRMAFDICIIMTYIPFMIFLNRYILITEDYFEKPSELIFYSVLSTFLAFHANIVHKKYKRVVLQDFLQKGREWMRYFVLQSFIETDIWHYLRFLEEQGVFYWATIVFEYLILFCSTVFCVIVCKLVFYEEDTTFYGQNLMFSIIYFFVAFLLRGINDLQKLILHFAYACVHVGCFCEYIGVDGSHFVILFGMILFFLLFLHYFLTFTPYGSPQEGASDDNPPGEGPSRRRHHSPGEGPSRRRHSPDEGPIRRQPTSEGPIRRQPPGEGPIRRQAPGEGRIRRQPPGEGPSRHYPSGQSKDDPPVDIPHGEGPSDDTGKSPKDSQWKPKQKRKGRKKR